MLPQRPPYFSVALLSALSLAYEILLMRLFSIIQWHHYAYMMIALALLGYGMSGTFIALGQRYLLPRFRGIYIACLLFFGLSAVLCFIAAQAIPFNGEEILWDGRQTYYLAAIFLLLTIPFFFAASAICLVLMYFKENAAQVYAVDLIGAGAGGLGIVLLLFVLFPQTALLVIGCAGLIAAMIAGWELQVDKQFWLVSGVIVLIAIISMGNRSLELTASPYKSMQQLLRVSGTHIIAERASPLGLLSVVSSDDIPLRHAPGMSLNAIQEPLPQLGLFTDGDNMTVITQAPEQRERLGYLDQMTSALPYHLKQAKRVLILGAGGGAEILQANYHHAAQIDAIELNPQVIDLVENQFNEFSGALYQQKNVELHIGEARGILSRNNHIYDLIQLALLDAFNASTSGLYALTESYLYTTEALQLYLQKLDKDGYLAITRWIKIPPRDTLKLFATAIDALKNIGSEAPEKQLVLIRSWQTSTLVIKNGIFNTEELNAVQTFCAARSFDLAYTPTITEDQVNRYNKLRQPVFYQAAVALFGDQREQFLQQYKFNLEPASDDRPYFHHFFKWSTLPEIISLRSKGGIQLIESGYMIFIATLVVAIVMSLFFILLPLVIFHRSKQDDEKTLSPLKVICYFFAIGLAFLFIEIAFIQKFILFLHHPIYAVAVTLAAFLIFAGLGSSWSKRLAQDRPGAATLKLAVFIVTGLSLFYTLSLGTLFTLLASQFIGIKIVITVLLIAPLAFFMGMPFPLAITELSLHAKRYIPWAWGINCCASVISAVLSTLLAIHFGFTAVILLAVLLYILVVFMFPAPVRLPEKRIQG
jgi:spermine/spermidine synthase